MAKVSIGGELTEAFEVTSGLRQGCILAPASSSYSSRMCSAEPTSPCQTLGLTYVTDRRRPFQSSPLKVKVQNYNHQAE